MLPPARFGAWAQTCSDLAAAVAAGPGIVALVGPEGSGKTYTLMDFVHSARGPRSKLRIAGEPMEPGVQVDLIDDVGLEQSALLDSQPAYPSVRVEAMRPEVLPTLLHCHPDAKVVRIHPMTSLDVRIMLETRRRQVGLPHDVLTLKAASCLDRLADGNPKRLDRLFSRAERTARANRSSRISGQHVEQADRDLAAVGPPSRPPPSPGPVEQSPEHNVEHSAEPTVAINEASVFSRGLGGARPVAPSDAGPSTMPPTPGFSVPPLIRSPPRVEADTETDAPVPAEPQRSSWDLLLMPTSPEAPADVGNAMRNRRRRGIAVITVAALGFTALASTLPADSFVYAWQLARDSAAKAGRYASAMVGSQPVGQAPRDTALVPPRPGPAHSAAEPPGDVATSGGAAGQQAASVPAIELPAPLLSQRELHAPGLMRPERDASSQTAAPSSLPVAAPPSAPEAMPPRLRADAATADAAPRRPGGLAEAARVLALARTMVTIGQLADAVRLFDVSAEMGSVEAAAAVAGYRAGAAAVPSLFR